MSYIRSESNPKNVLIGPISGVKGKNIELARLPPTPEIKHEKMLHYDADQDLNDTSMKEQG
ncbi:hypothetical protein BLOT_009679 [Blomia tropicalis]|nr:hypothetical protein BLOT_009679 [Blomia tropicalis]